MVDCLDIPYENFSQKFTVKVFDYQKQFSHLYSHRLAEMSQLLISKAQQKWGNEVPIKKLCDLREEQKGNCIIVGTIYKHQMHKPSILREISEENQLAPQPARQNYSDPEDKLVLEDELQRVRLFGKVDTKLMATGVVCAVLGTIEEDGRFDVAEFLFYESGPQKPLQVQDVNRWLVLISGLDQMRVHQFEDQLNLFQQWLVGNIHVPQRKSLVRLIVAGNSVQNSAELRLPSLQKRSSEPNHTVQAVQALDSWFTSWSRSLPVDVMPGPYDPANFMLPQQPFHECMFPQAAKNTTFHSVHNPYACAVDGALVVGCSGQNVYDLLRCTAIEKPLDALRNTLIWSHLAPTAPDTLACYPYVANDPFIMRECPHVYFTGNCNAFATELHVGSDGQRTRIVCVPSFCLTKSIAVVDLATLDCMQIKFGSDEIE